LASHRDELVISTKAGHPMWSGVYGDGGSRKHLLAGLDQSLKRLRLDYVDIFYHHRPDPETPLEESMGALVSAVRQGKALYVALSKYPAEQLARACAILREEKVPCIAHQIRYNLLEHPEGILEAADGCGCGNVVFSPLAQGLLTHKYAYGIPADSRMTKDTPCLKPSMLTHEVTEKLREFNAVAQSKGQSLTHYALRWLLDKPLVTSIVIGARTPEQLLENLMALA
jgi:L-glyceraldehyde 3-phosphate reductase